MAIFSKSQSLETRLKAVQQQRVDLAVKVSSAEKALVLCRDTVRKLAINGNDREHDAAIADQHRAELKLTSLQEASETIAAEIASIEAEIAAAADQKQRTETAAQIEELITQWHKCEADFVAAATRFHEVATRAATVTLDANGTSIFLQQAANEIIPAGKVVCTTLKSYARDVVEGRQSATMPTPAPEPVRLKIVSTPTRDVVALKNIRWLDKDGVMQCAGAAQRCVLPVALAETALAKNLAVPVGDKRVVVGIHGMVKPSFENCISLDGSPLPKASSAKSNAPPVMSTSFEPMPGLAKPYSVKVPTQTSPADLMATGTRSQPKESGDDEV
jgi:hypothetical protein